MRGLYCPLALRKRPIVGALGHADRHQPTQWHLKGLMLPGERKSIEPMTKRETDMRVRVGVIAILGLLFGTGTCLACSDFREPPVSFEGVKTRADLTHYIYQLRNTEYPDGMMDTEHHNCTMALIESEELYGGDHLARDRRYKADKQRFLEQVKQAGEAHLALLAAQPFKGSYDGSAANSTGTASKSNPSSTNAASRSSSSTSEVRDRLSPSGSSSADHRNACDIPGDSRCRPTSCDGIGHVCWMLSRRDGENQDTCYSRWASQLNCRSTRSEPCPAGQICTTK